MSIVRENRELQRQYNQWVSSRVEMINLMPKCPYIAHPRRTGWRAMVRSWEWALTGWMMKWNQRFRSRYLDRGGCLMERMTANEFYQ